MKTYMAKEEEIKREWFVVDAKGKVLGRLASEVAKILRGKHKPIYTSHVDTGDFVIVINAKDVVLTGDKENQKVYFSHSGYPKGHRLISAKEMRAKNPEKMVYLAVRGMLPKGPLGRKMLKKLKVYAGPEHPHQAQQPKELKI